MPLLLVQIALSKDKDLGFGVHYLSDTLTEKTLRLIICLVISENFTPP